MPALIGPGDLPLSDSAVREAILETTVALVSELGLRSVTMSQIATEAGIGREQLLTEVEALRPHRRLGARGIPHRLSDIEIDRQAGWFDIVDVEPGSFAHEL